MDLLEELEFDPETGLVPAVVQSDDDGRVLMLGYMDRRALEQTLDRGRVTFWSRSRQELWEKGATSGDWLEAVEVRADCDRDALLVRARPHGPTCHTGRQSCFQAGPRRPVEADAGPPEGDVERGGPDLSDAGPSPAPVLASVLEELVGVVARRDRDRPEGSYTASLLEAGPGRAARKVGEEALEVTLSAVDEPARLAEESADLLYHLAVLWQSVGLPADAVGRELAGRRQAGPGAGGRRGPSDREDGSGGGTDAGEAGGGA